MSELAEWLQAEGFGQYAELFADNAIDREALVELTDEHLKELGLPLGHRVKLLKAIRALREPEVGQVADRVTRPTPRAAVAERRQLTVMFCDLVGSTELAARLDPEDMGRVMRAYQECCTEVVERWGGHVAKYMGDGVLAYFGWPQAHEDDAERAVRAGLSITAAVAGLETPAGEALAARVGIATGLVMVGDLIGEGAAQEEVVAGETPNLAARLQGLAKPGSVVVAPATRRLLGGVFELVDMGGRTLRGFATPVRVWNVLGEGSSESRFEAARGRQLTPLVGRDDEMEILERRWKRGGDGEGQVVLITGEAGIGKSRLCATLRTRLADQPHTRLTYQCSPHHTDVAFHPVSRQLERAAGIQPEDDRDARLDRLEALLGASKDSLAEHIPILAALLSLPTTGRYAAADLDPQQLKERTYRTLVHSLASLTTRQPVLVVFEDLHWADPSTLELLDRLVDRAESLPVLVLITARPGFSAPWLDQAHVTRLALSRISRRDSRTLLAALVGPGSLPESAVDDITIKSDGIPLFVEEMTRAVLEARARGMNDATGSERVEVPASLQDSLMARLDRLTVGKAVAQMAAAIGREFGPEMLEPICGLSRRDLDQALDELLVAGLLNRRSAAPNVSYVFKHALVQDAAYNSLLRANRHKVHRRIAEALGDRLADQPAVLAHHWECAEEFDQALQYRLAAGERAAKQYAMWEAIAQYWRALGLLQQLPETNATRRQYVETVVALIGTGLIFWQSETEGAQALQHIDKALEIATESQALAHLARLEAFKGNYWHDELYFSQAVRHTAMVGDGRLSAEVARRYASYLGRIGQFEASHVHSERAIELYAGLGAGTEQGLAMAVELDPVGNFAVPDRRLADATAHYLQSALVSLRLPGRKHYTPSPHKGIGSWTAPPMRW